MRSTSVVLLFACALAGLPMAACSGEEGGGGGGDAALRFSVLPDWNKGELARTATALGELLTARLGVEVRYVPSNDYTACVNALAANKVDFVWLGGKTTVDAIDVGEGHVHVFATRDIDLTFNSYFIGNRDAVDAGRVAPVEDLAEWRGETGELRLTFGSKSSTSGHLMPRHYLRTAGLVPEEAFASVGYSGAGGHAGTLEAVANGSVDVGALNYAYYDAAPDEKKAKAPVLYTTPEYVDYAWVAHDRIGAPRLAKLRETMLGLDPEVPEERAVLDAWSAGRFVPAEDHMWDAIRGVRDSLGDEFLKK